MAVTTSRRRPSASLSAAGTSSVWAGVRVCIWGTRASHTAGFIPAD
jgi:hypothetical protein